MSASSRFGNTLLQQAECLSRNARRVPEAASHFDGEVAVTQHTPVIVNFPRELLRAQLIRRVAMVQQCDRPRYF